MDTDTGLPRRLPEWDPNALEEEVQIRERNIMTVYVNSNNEILCRKEIIDISQLKDLAKEFIANPEDKMNMPAKEEYEIPGFGTVYTTVKHVISLQTDVATQYAVYFKVQDELTKAYNELRAEWAQRQFHKRWEDCSADQKLYARGMYPSKISEAEPKEYGQNR